MDGWMDGWMDKYDLSCLVVLNRRQTHKASFYQHSMTTAWIVAKGMEKFLSDGNGDKIM